MGLLYKVKLIHSFTGLLCAVLFLLSIGNLSALGVKPSSFLTGFALYLPVAGTVIALLFSFFKNTFTYPILLCTSAFMHYFLSANLQPIAFTIPFTVLFIPYAGYFYKYRDFEEVLSVLRWLIPAALFISWVVFIPQSLLLGKDISVYFTLTGILVLLISYFKSVRIWGLLIMCAMTVAVGTGLFYYRFVEAGLCQVFFLATGIISFDYGKSHLFNKVTLTKLSRAKLILLPVFMTVLLLILADFNDYNVFEYLSQKSRILSKLIDNRTDV